jgi:hypothetical protein
MQKYAFPALILSLVFSVGCADSSESVDSPEDFTARLEAAFADGDATQRAARVRALFHPDGVDEMTGQLVGRASEMLARAVQPTITFEPPDADATFLSVLDGYEYSPNLAPEGYVVLTIPGAEPGNETRIPYARRDDGFHVLPSVVRVLVNPDAEPDKQLQMIVIGAASPPVTFEGWCDLALSNGTVERIPLGDQGAGNQTRIQRGQSIEACEITNTSERGSLSLRLLEDENQIFEQHVDAPEFGISYSP